MDQNQVSDVSLDGSNNGDAQQDQEKVFTRDQLSKIVNAERNKAVQSARLEAEQKHQQELQALQSQQQGQSNQASSPGVDTNAIYQQIQERFNKEMQEQQVKQNMQHVANNYLQKVAQGKTAYSDFDEVTKDFDPTAFPQLTFLVSGIENGGDVLYDLAKNPLKLAGLDRLAERNPRQAQSELMKLSKSITDNKQALADAENQNTPEPLDRLKPSRVSGSNGKMGISDLRNQPWLRG